MKQLRSIAWKEWRESRPYLSIGLGVFLVLPLLDGLQDMHRAHHYHVYTVDWIFFLGGTLAVFVGVGITTRDFAGRLEDFWRSRPVSIGRWLSVKYFVGLAIVLISCTLPPIVEICICRDKEAASYVIWFPFLWAAIFSIAFLAGCLLRRNAHAAMLSLGAMLLIYFLPIILPPLAWLNVQKIEFQKKSWDDEAGKNIHDLWSWLWGNAQFKFAGGMLFLALLAALFAMVAVKSDWRIISGRKTMFGSLAAVVLLLFATAAYRLGTNMPVLQTIKMPRGERIESIDGTGTHGIVAVYGWRSVPPKHPGDQWTWERDDRSRRLDLTDSGITLGPLHPVGERVFLVGVSPPNDPDIRYYSDSDAISADGHADHFFLHIEDFRNDTNTAIPLRPISPDSWQKQCLIFGQRLYIPGDQLITMDISRPLQPKIIAQTPLNRVRFDAESSTLAAALPVIPELPSQERLQFALQGNSFHDGLLCLSGYNKAGKYYLVLYREQNLTDTKVTFTKIGEYQPTVIDTLFGIDLSSWPQIANRHLYIGKRGGNALNPSITVLDADSPSLREIGHFAAPELQTCWPLADGRCVVGSNDTIYLVGPPPKHN